MGEYPVSWAGQRIFRRLAVVISGAFLTTFAVNVPVHAQATYTDRPVRLIVPYAAGGVADLSMRIVADKLGGHLKQQFIVENRPGAGGIIAAKAASSASADGYTILMTGNNNAISASLFKSLPYNVLTDFASVSTTSFFDLLIVGKSDSQLRSLQDVVGMARANPGRLNIATTNPGSTQHLAAVLFGSVTNTKVTIVPYKTSSEMATAILRGDVDIAFEFYSALVGPIGEKQMLVLASTGKTRTSFLPQVPTVKETGIENYEVASWNGIAVPTGTPGDVVQRLGRAINEVLPRPDVQERAKTMGIEMRGSTPAEMTELMTNEIAKWGSVIEKAGIPKHD
jgi:tripartite-type tricarboxylate transporter receptor subunit TctC